MRVLTAAGNQFITPESPCSLLELPLSPTIVITNFWLVSQAHRARRSRNLKQDLRSYTQIFSTRLHVKRTKRPPYILATESNHQQGRPHISVGEAESSDTMNYEAQALLMVRAPIGLYGHKALQNEYLRLGFEVQSPSSRSPSPLRL